MNIEGKINSYFVPLSSEYMNQLETICIYMKKALRST
jgi:hypothetical protein